MKLLSMQLVSVDVEAPVHNLEQTALLLFGAVTAVDRHSIQTITCRDVILREEHSISRCLCTAFPIYAQLLCGASATDVNAA